jgi:hypothetical protein
MRESPSYTLEVEVHSKWWKRSTIMHIGLTFKVSIMFLQLSMFVISPPFDVGTLDVDSRSNPLYGGEDDVDMDAQRLVEVEDI